MGSTTVFTRASLYLCKLVQACASLYKSYFFVWWRGKGHGHRRRHRSVRAPQYSCYELRLQDLASRHLVGVRTAGYRGLLQECDEELSWGSRCWLSGAPSGLECDEESMLMVAL